MDQAREFNFLFPFFLLLLPLLFFIFKHISSLSSKRLPFPPGPKPWPIIGNILQMGKMPHLSMTQFAQVYGPLISLRLGTQLLVVGSSPTAATEILKTHDRLLSARYVPQVTPYDDSVRDGNSLVWASGCKDKWKFLRALCRTELFSAKAIESQAILREQKVGEMVDYLGSKEGKIVHIGEIVFTTIVNTLTNLFFSKDLVDWENQEEASGLKGMIRRIMESATTPNIADFYPIFAGLDLQGLRKNAFKSLKEMYGVWEVLIKERRESQGYGVKKLDFLNVFLANGFTDDQINTLVAELFTAGTDTTTSTVEWAMAELLKNKEAMKKLQEELNKEINTGSIKESHISQLPYLQACVKETLRLHPPAPFLLPHKALETCEVMNYTIPKNSQVFVNVWAIGRDPTFWEDHLSFKPDRFLSSNLDFKGHDYEFLPFGAGRRICPGLPMATKQVQLVLASLVRCFDWSLPNGENPTNLDMTEKFGITLQKEQPLLVIPKQKL